MFLSGLSVKDKGTFLALAAKMIAADGVLAPEEVAILGDLVRELDMLADPKMSSLEVEELCSVPPTPQAQACMLLELASIAHIDRQYADEERSLLAEIARQWQIDALTLVRIERWAVTRIELSREAAEVIREVELGSNSAPYRA